MIGVFTGKSYGSRVENVTFIRLETELVENLHLFQPSDWMVLTCLTMHIGSTNVCWPSLAKIAKQTGLSEQTIKTAIKRLCTVTVGSQRVLAVNERRTETGRQTSNLYIVMPTNEQIADFESAGEGTNFTPLEGTNFIPPITLNKIQKEVITPIVPTKVKPKVSLPKDDDPAYILYMAYREALGYSSEFSPGEWQGVHLILREMVRGGVTADEMRMKTSNLLRQWKKESMVTLRALWKYWSTTASANPSRLPSAMTKVMDINDMASAALRAVRSTCAD
jgi:hypothetical protein